MPAKARYTIPYVCSAVEKHAKSKELAALKRQLVGIHGVISCLDET